MTETTEVLEVDEARYMSGQEALKRIRDENGVNRVLVNFKSPIALTELTRQNIQVILTRRLGEQYGEDIVACFMETLNDLLHTNDPIRCGQLGIRDDTDGIFEPGDKIKFGGPVEAPGEAYKAKTLEGWVMKWDIGEVKPILVGAYGFTNPEQTRIAGQERAMERHNLDGLSAAFTFTRAWPEIETVFYNVLGRERRIGRGSKVTTVEQAENFLRHTQPRSRYAFGEMLVYSTTPFSRPVDVIYYPHLEELGGDSYEDPAYLGKSVNAKAMIRRYIEGCTGETIPMLGCRVQELLDK